MPRTDCDVAVVGGGFAGVTAARDLRKGGLDVVLLEARDRLGGRTFTQEREGYKVELGGTWIHWLQPHVWREIQLYGLKVEETPGALPDRAVYLSEGQRHEVSSLEIFSELLPTLERYFEGSRVLWERPFDAEHSWEALAKHDPVSALERLRAMDLPPRSQVLVEGFLELVGGCRADQVSYVEVSRWHALSGYSASLLLDTTGRYKLTEGTEALIRAMIADGQPAVRTESAVRRIEQSGELVRLTMDRESDLTARAAVVALPMNVLKDLEFSPAVSGHKMEASRETHAGSGFKVLFEVKGQLGNLVTLGTSTISPLISTGTYASKGDRTLMFGFGVDSDAFDLDDREAVEKAFRVYMPDAEVTTSFGHDWTADPYSQGTWCGYRPGQLVRHWQGLKRNEGRLFFAGGDYCEGWRGFIDGAIGSGARAARGILELLG